METETAMTDYNLLAKAPMRDDKIRLRSLLFNWMNETVDINFTVGTQGGGGYEDRFNITFEKFQELIDTTKLQHYLTKQP